MWEFNKLDGVATIGSAIVAIDSLCRGDLAFTGVGCFLSGVLLHRATVCVWWASFNGNLDKLVKILEDVNHESESEDGIL